MIRQPETERANRLAIKTQDQALLTKLQREFNYSPFESRAVLETVKDTYMAQLRTPDTLKPGQMVILAISADEPPGKPLKECQFIPIVVTVHAPGDQKLRQEAGRQGVACVRRVQLTRMAWEAVAQETYLTIEDVAYRILNCGVRTLEEDVAYLRSEGKELPLRGQQLDIGRGETHKIVAVRLFLERYTYTQIQRRINHSPQAIQRYITDFVAVASMTVARQTVFEISFLRQISPGLVREYQALYTEYNTEAHRERLAEVIALFRAPVRSVDAEKKGSPR
jgi:hypothetical protein